MIHYFYKSIVYLCLMHNIAAFHIDTEGLLHNKHERYCAIGCGTFPLQGELCSAAITRAIELGYSIIDTATHYENFESIATVLEKYDRKALYVISKVWPDSHTAQLVRDDLLRTLQQLRTPYLDAYLVHWPNSSVPIKETLSAMQELQKQGLIRHIGLSNVTVNHMRRVVALNIPITWVQVEMHPGFCDFQLLELCQKHSITMQAWAPLDRGLVDNNALLVDLGEKYGKTAAQIALRWIIQHGCIPLPCSKNSHHMQENKDVFDFVLSPQEMDMINAKARDGKRRRVRAEADLGFTDEFDFSYDECWPDRT